MPAVHTRIHNAIVTTLSPPSVLYETQPQAVKKRKRPRREKNDPDLLLVISPKNITRESFTAEDDYAYKGIYEFLATSIIPNDAKAIPDGIVEQWREAIQTEFMKSDALQTLVPEISHIEVTMKPTYSVSALDKNFDYTPTEIVVHTIEPRVV